MTKPLTAREREIMSLLVIGMTRREIGQRLGIQPKGVDSHRHNILTKMGVRNVVELAVMLMSQPHKVEAP